jgi:hypothetical protein
LDISLNNDLSQNILSNNSKTLLLTQTQNLNYKYQNNNLKNSILSVNRLNNSNLQSILKNSASKPVLKRSKKVFFKFDQNQTSNEIFNKILFSILTKDIIKESLADHNKGKYYSILNREKMLFYEQILEKVVKQLCRETVKEYTDLQVKKYFISREKVWFSGDPCDHVNESLILTFCTKESKEIVKESISEVLVEYIILNFFERVFYKSYIPSNLLLAANEASNEVIIEAIFDEIVVNLSLEIGEPLAMLGIEEEMREQEDKELVWFFNKYVERMVTEDIVQSILGRMMDVDLEELAEEAHQKNEFDEAEEFVIKNFKYMF